MLKHIGYLFILVAALMATNSFATLGEAAASVQTDRVKLHASQFAISNANPLYRVSTYKVAPQISIREYISPTGMVFAVSWSGPLKPNLEQLLGRYYATLTYALQKRHRGRSPLYIKYPHIVIESGGHPQSFFGRAYIPSAIPAGVMESEIQ